jgi:hypothetical protein
MQCYVQWCADVPIDQVVPGQQVVKRFQEEACQIWRPRRRVARSRSGPAPPPAHVPPMIVMDSLAGGDELADDDGVSDASVDEGADAGDGCGPVEDSNEDWERAIEEFDGAVRILEEAEGGDLEGVGVEGASDGDGVGDVSAGAAGGEAEEDLGFGELGLDGGLPCGSGGPSPPPPPLPPPLPPGRNGPLASVAFMGGTIAFYKNGSFEAVCPCHARCRLTRIGARGRGDRGRPLGLLAAHIMEAEGCDDKELHMLRVTAGYDFEYRMAARLLLADEPGALELFSYEREKRPDEGDEPDRHQ